ncbi:MAG: Cardiolipin synthase [Candidatus Heimdallarchaeota archaeon LC_2]|nr:MAG: Cardiolipin synthase [Candidatus Heimdallarchaeota archaeon LC_2]
MRIKPKLFLILILLSPNLLLNSQATLKSANVETIKSDSLIPITPNLYTPKFSAFNVKEQMKLSPLFTPDNAIDLYAGWLKQANTTIDLQNQYIRMWSGTDTWVDNPSPIVRELVNAQNRGVAIRVQVREDADDDDVTTYLLNEGIQVRWMGSQVSDDGDGFLSATHNKMILIDDKVSLISSINFGEGAFTTNREAGMVIQSSSVTNYYKSIFESDWSDGEMPPNVLRLTKLPKKISDIQYQSTYTSHTNIPKTNFTGLYNVTAFANPDNADKVIFKYLKNAKESIYVSMYTISRPDFNNTLIALKKANPLIDIQVLISNRRVGDEENEDTHAAAKSLVDNQIPVYNSTKDDDKVDNFYHNKYWIIDGKHTFIYSGNWSPRSTTPQLVEGDISYVSGETNRDMGIAVHDATDIASFVKNEVWDKDVGVAEAWELSIGVKQLSFDETDVIFGDVNLSLVINGIEGATASYRFGNNEFIPIILKNNEFSVILDTTTIPNGITTFEVKAELNSQIFTDKVQVNVANYDSTENWRFLITEVLPNPSVVSDTKGEFFEITNSFPFDLLIGGWRVGDDSNSIEFTKNTRISAYTSWIIARNTDGFNAGYGKTADYQLSMSLTNDGDVISLINHKDEVIDSIAYGDGISTDGSDSVDAPTAEQSIHRFPLHIDTNSPNDFTFDSPNPKGAVPIIELLLVGSTDTQEASGFSYMIFLSSIIFAVYTGRRRRRD